MEKSKQFQEVLSLGKTLAKEFSDNGRIDVTTAWMAHYLSEIITKAQNATSALEKQNLQKECTEIILELWKKRSNYKDRVGPLRGLEHAVSVIKSLKDEDKDPLSWRRFRGYEDDTEWGKFIRNVRERVESILKITLCTVVNERVIRRQSDWLNHKDFLTEEEKQILEYFDQHLGASHSSFRIIISDGNDKPAKKVADKTMQAFDKIQELINEQLKSLDDLKTAVMKSRSVSKKSSIQPKKKNKK